MRAEFWIVAMASAVPAAAHADPTACSKAGAVAQKARLTADAVEACFDDNNCWRLPIAARKWELGKDWGDAKDPPAAAPVKLTVCTKPGVECHAIEVAGASGDTVTNSAHTLAAVIGPPVKLAKSKDQSEEQPILVYDVANGKLAATIHGWKTGMGDPAFFRTLRFLDETTLYAAIANSPVSSAARLYDGRTGKKLADVGGPNFDLDEGAVAALAKGAFAFGAFSGTKVVVHDGVTGKSHPAIGLAAPKADAVLAQLALFQVTADGATLVALRGDALSGVTLIDAKSRNGQRVAIPICK